MGKKIISLLLLFLFCGIFGESKSFNLRKNILVIHSYHQGQLWTNSEINGIFSVLNPLWKQYNVFIEYMDTKRFYSKKHINNLKNTYQDKYKHTKIDVIIAADDNAFEFAINNENIFNNAPIVFCGVNSLDIHKKFNKKNVTGILETINFDKNIKLAKKIVPNLKNIYVVNDETPTGLANTKRLKKYIQTNNKDKFNYIFLNYMSMEALCSKISDLPEDGIILLLSYTRDADGKVFLYREVASKISKSTNLPIIVLWDFYIGHGALGGYVTSGFAQGKFVAQTAIKIINGLPAYKIPINIKSSNIYMFDAKQLSKFNINLKNIPNGSKILNVSKNFWEAHKKQIIIFLLIGILLIVALIVLAVSLNIRRSALKQMAKSRIFLKNILDSMPSLIITLNFDGKISNCNARLENFINKSEKQLKGKLLAEIFSEIHLEKFSHQVINAVKNGETLKKEKIEAIYNNNRYIFNLIAFPLEIGKFENAVVRIDDVTTKSKIEEMMVETEKMISIGGLAGGIAHEINNPLGGIIQGIQNVIRRIDTSFSKNQKVAENLNISLEKINMYLQEREIIKFLNSIQESGIRAAEIIKNMLNFAQKKSAHVIIDKPYTIMEKSLKLAKSDYSLKKVIDFEKIEIVKEYATFVKPLRCNQIEIEQVLLNLIKNAAEAINESKIKKPKITLKVIQAENYILFEVKDNGHGIPKNIKEHIFEPFFSTKNYRSGSGIGLAVCYYIVTNNHHGKIIVDSNFGTKFTVRLPNNLELFN